MKKHILSAVVILAATATYAQNALNTAQNAVRYTTDNTTGTARFRAMSGAFGAVGGDLSAISINPAGSAIFNFNSGTASFSSYNVSNNANYFGTSQRNNDNSFDLNQIGAIFVFNNNNTEATLNKFTVGFNYENTNSFHDEVYSRGVNPTNSIDKYFLRFANGTGEGFIPLSTLNNAYFEDLNYNDQQAYLGYNAFVFNPTTPTSGPYVTNVPQTGNYYQENFSSTSGYNGKIAFNFAVQLLNKLYLGANLNAHFTDYLETSSFYENPNNPLDTGMQSLQFDNRRYTYGGGFSFNVGAIYKVTESLRAGLAYESPTWMNLQNEVTQRIASYCPECDENNSSANTFVFDPGMTFLYDDYTIRNPSKWTGSLAYVFGKSGLVSIDYSLKDYGNTKYTSSGYGNVNNELSNTLDVASTIRVGVEYRISKVSLRGGYRFEQSPYKNGTTIGDLNGASGGLGYNFGASRLDLAYSWYQRKYDSPLLNAGFTDAARVKSTNNNVTLSYTIDL